MWTFANSVWILVGVLSVVHHSTERSTNESPDYVAAVVEYNPFYEPLLSASEVYARNVDNYVKLIEEAANHALNADIIVFAEAGLVTLMHSLLTEIPRPSDKIVPCSQPSASVYDNLRAISCAAKENEIFVVINLSEIYPCPNGTVSEYGEPCPETGELGYNSNVVFDRSGAVVARYRKYNLFGEDPLVAPPKADLVTFASDFGVTFGLFTCFDLMFEKPAIQLVKESGITDLIFPSAWFAELPFLTAVQAQAAWASAMDVNFLTSGYNNPAGGSGGSGIYAGSQGPLVYVMPAEPSTHLLISKVTKKTTPPGVKKLPQTDSLLITSRAENSTGGIFMKQDDLSAYKTLLLVSDSPRFITLCDGDLCCHFEVAGNLSGDHMVGERYFNRLVAFDGVRTFTGVATGGVQICGVMSCVTAKQESCGQVPAVHLEPTDFEVLTIAASFNKESAAQFPNTLVDEYLLIPADDFTFTQAVNGTLVDCSLELTKPTSLLTFAIFGREFSRDGDEVTLPAPSASSVPQLAFLTVLAYCSYLLHIFQA